MAMVGAVLGAVLGADCWAGELPGLLSDCRGCLAVLPSLEAGAELARAGAGLGREFEAERDLERLRTGDFFLSPPPPPVMVRRKLLIEYTWVSTTSCSCAMREKSSIMSGGGPAAAWRSCGSPASRSFSCLISSRMARVRPATRW